MGEFLNDEFLAAQNYAFFSENEIGIEKIGKCAEKADF